MNYELLNLLIAIIVLLNTIAFAPIFKFIFYVIKEINYMKGHLGIDK